MNLEIIFSVQTTHGLLAQLLCNQFVFDFLKKKRMNEYKSGLWEFYHQN